MKHIYRYLHNIEQIRPMIKETRALFEHEQIEQLDSTKCSNMKKPV